MYFFGASSSTALATIALMGATVAIPTATPSAAPRTILASPEATQVPVQLAAAINTSPTTLGVADSYLYNLSDADVNRTLDELQALGVSDVRIAVPWVYVQQYNADAYDWAKLDSIVNAAANRDMGVLGVITATPAWAGSLLNGHPDPQTYADFTSAVATRYAGKISAYEIWNEPNGVTFYSPVSPADYTELLKAAYPAIKAADPDAIVIGGVLGAVTSFPGITMNAPSFVQGMYASGAHGYFDALSYHPYHYTTPFSLGDVADAPINQVASIRNLMIANGDGDRQLWATEYGLPTSSVSQAQQAAYIHDFVVSWQQVDGAGPIFIYTTRDSETGAFDDEANFGLFKTDWTKKQAADTVADLITDLADGTAEPFDVTPYLPNNSFLQGLTVFVKQIINQLLVVPKFILQMVNSAITGVVTFVSTIVTQIFHTLTGTPAAAATEPRAQSFAAAAAATSETHHAPDTKAIDDRPNARAAIRGLKAPAQQQSVAAGNKAAKTAQDANNDAPKPASGTPNSATAGSGSEQVDTAGEHRGQHRSERNNTRTHPVGSARA